MIKLKLNQNEMVKEAEIRKVLTNMNIPVLDLPHVIVVPVRRYEESTGLPEDSISMITVAFSHSETRGAPSDILISYQVEAFATVDGHPVFNPVENRKKLERYEGAYKYIFNNEEGIVPDINDDAKGSVLSLKGNSSDASVLRLNTFFKQDSDIKDIAGQVKAFMDLDLFELN